MADLAASSIANTTARDGYFFGYDGQALTLSDPLCNLLGVDRKEDKYCGN